MTKPLRFGFSPCPNDTFIFEAIVNKKIDTLGLDFDFVIEDVETLNKMALQEQTDISKLSFHAFLHASGSYRLFDAGSALGSRCGPLLIARRIYEPDEIPGLNIAIPGNYTTAALLLKYAFPETGNNHEAAYNQIENDIIDKKYDAGVIIHENRFTYQNKGLKCCVDLGQYWEDHTGQPIPLGGIAAHRRLSQPMLSKIAFIIRQSVSYAFNNREGAMPFVKKYAAETSDDVIGSHIALYVNQYTLSLGEKGRKAIGFLFDYALKNKIIPNIPPDVFIEV